MPDLHIVILAAGKGTRMRSALPKVLHKVSGLPLLAHVLRTSAAVRPTTTTVVVGHQADAVRAYLAGETGVRVVEQEPQLGTGHALLQAERPLEGRRGTVILLSGDVPLLTAGTLQRLVDTHEREGAAATVLTAVVANPAGYGRIVRADGRLERIVEDRDASPAEREIHEINSGIYAFALTPLFAALREIGTVNAQGEYYLPDLIAVYRRAGQPVTTATADDVREIRGVNSRAELAAVSATLRDRKNAALMESGVTLVDPSSAWVGPDVVIGEDTILQPNVHLEGRTTIGARCEIHSGVRIIDSFVGDGVLVNNHCLVVDSRIADGAQVGPFAHLRPKSDVGPDAKIGNFVELKKTSLGRGSKANHLAYLGDATIGERVNVGAGTITCNYDGTHKYQTVIEDGAFIGSDTQLIAPVRIGAGAYVAAGSSITRDVPEGALGIARGTQVNKDGWVARGKRKRE
jgi:bifunctional UDP-N-acetylglucosamine pyrophosphorylase / glucosamine-1-phosphate N-acetyltransferase